MKKLLILISVCITFSISAQVMPSPDAAASIQSSSVPIDLFSGSATVGVPIYAIENNNGSQIPISLQYKTRAFQVSEIATSVGLGWELIAGGAITRMVKDLPDEVYDRGGLSFRTGYDEETLWQHLWSKYVQENNNRADFERDIYYYSIPGGGGRFIQLHRIRPEGERTLPSDYPRTFEYYTLPYSDIKIEHVVNSKTDSKWTITDSNGNKYLFGHTNASRETTTTETLREGSIEYEENLQYVSTWRLNEIKYANQPGSNSIKFTYSKSNTPIKQEVKTESAVFVSYDIPDQHFLNSQQTTTHKTETYISNLSAIDFGKGKALFSYSPRNDLTGGSRLSGITIKDYRGKSVMNVELSHVYAYSSNSTLKEFSNCGEMCKRLMLKSVSINNHQIREFEYLNEVNSDYELPPRNSNYVSATGHYYPYRTNELLPIRIDPDSKRYLGFEGINDQSKYAKSNVLTKVKYPTGGYTAINYSIESNADHLTVSSIENYDDGKLISGQSYLYNGASSTLNYSIDSYRQFYDNNKFFIVNSHATDRVNDLNPFGFKTVTVNDLKTGKKVINEFTQWEPIQETVGGSQGSFFDTDLSPPYQFQITSIRSRSAIVNGPRKYMLYIDKNHVLEEVDETDAYPDFEEPPGSSKPLLDYRIGLPSSKSSYDSDGKITSRIEYLYKNGNEEYSILNRVVQRPALNGDPYSDPSNWYKLYVAEYPISCRPLVLDHTLSIAYDENENEIFRSRTDLSYHYKYKNIVTETETYEVDDEGYKISDRDTYSSRRRIFYPFDSYFNTDLPAIELYETSAAFLEAMEDINIISIPVASIDEVKMPGSTEFELAKVHATTFQMVSGLFLPFQNFELNLDNLDDNWDYRDMMLTGTVNYNSDGQITSKKDQDGITTVYSYDDAGYLESVTIDPGVESMKRTTTYEHYPLIGLKSVTGPDGRKVTYKYDERNRLLLTKDNEGNILKRYRYNYAGESNNLSASLGVSYGYNKTCSRIGFSVSGANNSYGKSKYTWSFGDSSTESCGDGGLEGPLGQPIEVVGTSNNQSNFESSSNSASHVFSEPGDYTVTVKIFNPEVGKEKVVTRNITIHELYSSAKIHGPDSREYCSNSGGDEQIEQVNGLEEQTIDPGDDSSGGSGYPNAYFSIGFDNSGARCQDWGSSFAVVKYKSNTTNQWVEFGEDGRGSLPSNAFYYSSNPYTIEIMGEISDNCSSVKQTAFHTLTVTPCSSSGGTGGTGGTGDGDNTPDGPTDPTDEFLDPGNGGG